MNIEMDIDMTVTLIMGFLFLVGFVIIASFSNVWVALGVLFMAIGATVRAG